jgi:KaiC/GvpD/RAD55 family RecA-like ATPase
LDSPTRARPAADTDVAGPISDQGELPRELLRFLGLDGPLNLLVRGRPGCGKTTLALTLLQAYRGKRIFLATRASRKGIARDFPWLEAEGANAAEIVDLEESVEEVVDSQLALAPKGPMRRGGRAFRAQTEHLWLPTEIQALWRRKSNTGRALVVFDSWDAFTDGYLGRHPDLRGIPNREELERVLLRFLRQAGFHAILVLERSEMGALDYLVDGVLSLSRRSQESRLERWLEIEKLRGTRIARPTYPFTLEGGRFRTFPPTPSRIEFAPPVPDPDPTPDDPGMWPGSNDLNRVFGRLPLGGISLLEVDTGMPEFMTRLLYAPAALHVLLTGGNVLEFPPVAVLPGEIWTFYRRAFPGEEIAKQLRLVHSTHRTAEVGAPLPLGGAEPRVVVANDGLLPTSPEVAGFLRSRAGRAGNLAVISIDAVSAFSQAEDGAKISPRVLVPWVKTHLEDAPAHTILIGRSDDPIFASLRGAASRHLRIREVEGRVFVYGIRPLTEGFVLDFAENAGSSGRPRLFELVPIV